MKNNFILLPLVAVIVALCLSIQPPMIGMAAPVTDTMIIPEYDVDSPDTAFRFSSTDEKIELLKDKTQVIVQQNRAIEATTKELIQAVEAAQTSNATVIDTLPESRRRSWVYRLLHPSLNTDHTSGN